MSCVAPLANVMTVNEILVSAVMPCLNEEKTLGLCIAKVQRAFDEMGIAGEVVVADNGSTDRSVEIAVSHGARVVHERRKGYGSALLAGISTARGRIVIMADADDSYDWAALGDFVRKIDEGYDLVIGNRFKGGIEPGAMPPLHRYLGNPVLSTLARVMYRIPVNDFHCGMRAFTRDAFGRMNVRTAGMEFATEMVVCAAQAGLRITEIPTRLYPDKRDRPPHLRSFRDGWRHLRFMLTYAPDWLYLIPGGPMFLLGTAGMVVLASGPVQIGNFSLGIHFLALTSLLTLLGANIVGFGLLARLINARRNPIRANSAFGRLLSWFTLERGLIIGGAFTVVGLSIDLWLLVEWIARGFGDMAGTVHLAFVATTIMLLGVNAAFASFLFNMLRDEHAK